MRNSFRRPGVYSIMCRVPLYFVLALTLAAQQRPQQDPMDAAFQAYWQPGAPISQTSARREELREMLRKAPVDSPRFGGWASQLATMYQNAGWSEKSRAVLQESLDRASALGESNPSRISILVQLSNSWRQDGNLLKALSYLAQAAAAQAAAPPPSAALSGAPKFQASFGAVTSGRFVGDVGGPGGFYNQLAGLYRQLGRPDAIAALTEKFRSAAAADPLALARFYDQQGQLDDAAAAYKKLSESANDPQAITACQLLAGVDARRERYSDAAADIRKAIELALSSGRPEYRSQASWMRQTLAGYLRQAGAVDQADQVWAQLLQDSRGREEETQMLGLYGQHLAESGRAPQGQALIKQYLDDHSGLEPAQRINALYHLSDLARRAGDTKSAQAYSKEAQSLQPQSTAPPTRFVPPTIGRELNDAQAALHEHRVDDAYTLALHAIDTALQSADAPQLGWQATNLARAFIAEKEPAKADQVLQRSFAVAQTLAADNRQTLMNLSLNYVRFLISQPAHAADVPAAIQRLRDAVVEGSGPQSVAMSGPIQVKIEFARARKDWPEAKTAARELLEFQSSLSGDTSEPYLSDLKNVAQVYVDAGDSAGALPLLRKSVVIADLLAMPENRTEWRRAQTRMDAALALARLEQFDEAETLAQEAIALQPKSSKEHSPMPAQLAAIRAQHLAKQQKP